MDEINLIDFDSKTKKKTKKAPGTTTQTDQNAKQQVQTQQSQQQVAKVDFDKQYALYLERITKILRQNNPSLAQQTSLQLEKPVLEKQGTKKIIWRNFDSTCKQMNRDPNHVYQYFLIELGTEGNLADEKFIIKGKYTNQNIESLIKKYLLEFVMCQHCKSSNTVLTKDIDARLYTKECKNCKATMSVSTLRLVNKKKDR